MAAETQHLPEQIYLSIFSILMYLFIKKYFLERKKSTSKQNENYNSHSVYLRFQTIIIV